MNKPTTLRRIFVLTTHLLLLGAFLAFEPTPADSRATCIADSIGELRFSKEPVTECQKTDLACREACLGGDAEACLGRAFAIEQDEKTHSEAVLLFHRACLLGSALGCTNYAASVWGRDHTLEEYSCAGRTFVSACKVEEPWACGMLGRMIMNFSKTPADVAGAQEILELACDELRGFSCRVLAKHLEAGEFGDYKPERIDALLRRACDGGDPDGCGMPESAAETFRD